jgi:hypothetical protein
MSASYQVNLSQSNILNSLRKKARNFQSERLPRALRHGPFGVRRLACPELRRAAAFTAATQPTNRSPSPALWDRDDHELLFLQSQKAGATLAETNLYRMAQNFGEEARYAKITRL